MSKLLADSWLQPKKRLDQDRVASAYDELLGDASNGLNFHQGKLTGEFLALTLTLMELPPGQAQW